MSNRYTSKHLWFKSSKSGLIFFIVLMTICLVAFLKQSWGYDRFVAEGRQSRLVHVFFSHIVKYLSNFQLKYHRSFVRTWNSILWMQDSFLPPASQKLIWVFCLDMIKEWHTTLTLIKSDPMFILFKLSNLFHSTLALLLRCLLLEKYKSSYHRSSRVQLENRRGFQTVFMLTEGFLILHFTLLWCL